MKQATPDNTFRCSNPRSLRSGRDDDVASVIGDLWIESVVVFRMQIQICVEFAELVVRVYLVGGRFTTGLGFGAHVRKDTSANR